MNFDELLARFPGNVIRSKLAEIESFAERYRVAPEGGDDGLLEAF